MTIVSPRTFARWASREKKTGRTGPKKVGRPRTEQEIRELVVKLAKETGWGYTRIQGELVKLGVRKISRNTVAAILKEHGLALGLGSRHSERFRQPAGELVVVVN